MTDKPRDPAPTSQEDDPALPADVITDDMITSLIAGPPVPLADHAAILPDLTAWLQAEANPDAIGHPAEAVAEMLIHSRHLQTLARQQADAILPILDGKADDIIDDAIRTIAANPEDITDDNAMMKAIRRLRQRTALAVALGDIAGMASIDTQMQWLSDAADAAINASVRYLFAQAERRGQINGLPDDLGGCGWVILALGKLGARELNYSSDVDLIIMHDPITNPLTRPEESQKFYVGMTRSLVKLLSTATGDGIGWRVDLRLRPDPGATAVSIQADAAIGYYESIARTWERAAFIRARPVAGDMGMGRRFLDDIQPFIWRRTLDYTVLDDMATMLRRPASAPGWTGFNLKTGKGGIRSIEFLTHVLQLVGGGRSASLREDSTLHALVALAEADWITQTQRDVLSHHYHLLRQVEHRLQMMADAQTHSLPRTEAEITSFAAFLGYRDADDFLGRLATVLDTVSRHSAHRLFETEGPQTDNAPSLEDEDGLQAWLANKGFARPADISNTLSGWLAGRIATTRSERARALLARMMPDILDQLSEAESPDDCFAAFAGFVEGLPASVQIFSLLDHNRDLGRLLGDILVLSPRLARQLRRHPMLFDLVLIGDFFEPLEDATAFELRLRDEIAEQPVELALDAVTRLTRERQFRAEVQLLSGVVDTRSLGHALADTADAAIRVVADLARQDMERRHGSIVGSLTILGFGRLGLRDLTATSDIDLVFVWDGDETSQSNGQRAIGASTYFTRLAQTMVNWLGGATGEGKLFDVDVRLRPDGEKGSLAPSRQRFTDYYQKEAWIWEKMALAKARCITASDGSNDIAQTIAEILASPLDPDDIAKAVNDMAARLRSSYGTAPEWQLRKQPGGIGELDLLLQGLRLMNQDLFAGSGQNGQQIIETLQSQNRLSQDDAGQLADALSLFTELHHTMRLVLGGSDSSLRLSPAAVHFVLTGCDSPDEATLNARLKAVRGNVEAAFSRLLPGSPISK